MRYLRVLQRRLRSLFRRRTVEDELERELNIHLEQLTRERMADGLSEEEARRAARLDFGPPLLVLEQCRDARRLGLLEDLFRDIRYGSRILLRSPTFAVTAVLTLALGIGANTAIFSLVDAVLLRSLPVHRPHELVFLQTESREGTGGAPPYPCFARIREEAFAFEGLAAFATDELRFVVDGRLEQVFGQVASGNYHTLLGLTPALGRLMTVEDEQLNPPVAVIGYGYWQRRFGGSPDVIGRTIVSGNRVHTIVGVTPPEFWGLEPGRQVDVTVPITIAPGMLANESASWFGAVGRLRAGADAEQARIQADTVFQTFLRDSRSAELTQQRFNRIRLAPAARGLDGLRRRFSRALFALTLVGAMVLLIACANLGNLLLVRGAARGREFAIRLATGAGTGRLCRQLLTETLLLFVVGATAGLLVARLTIQGLTGFFAIGRNPIVLDVGFDWRLTGFAAAVTLAAGFLTGLWPAVRASRANSQASMKDGESRVAGSHRFRATGRLLVVSQVALSLVLLLTAAIFVKTMANLRAVDLGFASDGIVTMSVDPILPTDRTGAAREQFWLRSLERIRTLPGVRAASLSVLTPLSGRDTGRIVSVQGHHPQSEMDRLVHVNHVSEDYFRVFGIPLLDGRDFTASDTLRTPRVAIVNDAAAKAFFGGRSPIGETLDFGQGHVFQVIGVAANYKHKNLREEAQRFAFVPLWQRLERIGRITLAVSSSQIPLSMARTVSSELTAIDPNTLVSDIIPVKEQIEATLVSERLLSALAAWFAGLAILLAAIGLYGILSYSVARRRAEFGVRIALGASPSKVAWSVCRDVIIQVGLGVAIGVPGAWATAQASAALLFGVTPIDPGNYAVSVLMLTAIAGIAAWLPTRRACAIDPCEALRRE